MLEVNFSSNLAESAAQRHPLLYNKLTIPSVRPYILPRTRLAGRLEEGNQRTLTLLCAGAGSGKTSLLSEWAKRKLETGSPVGWLSLDAEDNDPARFWSYFFEALQATVQEIPVNFGQTCRILLQSIHPTSNQAFLTCILNDLARIACDVTLVLDDYHRIESETIHDGMNYLLDHASPNLHLVLATRSDPPFSLYRLRVRDQLVELRDFDLKFNLDETTQFLNPVMKLDLSSSEINALELHTEGWIAGLQLAALSLRATEDKPSFIRSFTGSNRYVADFLLAEVFGLQEKGIQSFLLETCILEYLNASLCQAVTLRQDSQEVLQYLERENLFLLPLDPNNDSYRYHQLFADFLRYELHRKSPEHETELHQRASKWYESNGLIREAVSHAVTSRNFERAAAMMEKTAWEMLKRSEVVPLLGWLEALPPEFEELRPQLCISHAWALICADYPELTEPYLEKARLILERAKTSDQQAVLLREHALQEIEMVRVTAVVNREDVASAAMLLEQVADRFDQNDLEFQTMLIHNRGMAKFFEGDIPSAAELLKQAIEIGRVAKNIFATLVESHYLATCLKEQGLLLQAYQVYLDALDYARLQKSQETPVAGLIHFGLADSLREQNQLTAAYETSVKGVKTIQQAGTITFLVEGYIVTARVLQGQGNYQEAQQILEEAVRVARGCRLARVTERLKAWQARLWLSEGNLEKAIQWASRQSFDLDIPCIPPCAVVATTLIRVLIHQGKVSEAVNLINPRLEHYQLVGRSGSVIELLMLKAMAFHELHKYGEALGYFNRTIQMAEPEGYLRMFIDEGQPVKSLLARLKRSNEHNHPLRISHYLERLMASFSDTETSPIPFLGAAKGSATDKLSVLSEREIDVLRLIAEGLTDKEIAQRSYIAESTVKTHVKNILFKLKMPNRYQAAILARNLLSPKL